MPRQRSRSPLSPTLATESATVRLFFILSVLLCSVNKAGLRLRPGFCTVCDFAHARPIMLSILLVIIGATDALSRYIDRRTYVRRTRCHDIDIDVRTYVHRYCACAALRANVAGQIGNRFSSAESAFSACIASDQLSQHYDDHTN